MNGTDGKDTFKHIPWIFFELLVSKAESAIFNIYVQNDNLDIFTNLGKFGRMFDLLRPRKV